jgi:hypothetical protein
MYAGKLMKYVDSKWRTIETEDKYKLTKMEGQVSASHCRTAVMRTWGIAAVHFALIALQ